MLSQSARDVLVLEHLRVARLAAESMHRRCPRFFSRQDLYSEAVLAMLRGTPAYDQERNPSYPAFITVVVRNHLISLFRKACRQVRVKLELGDDMLGPQPGHPGDFGSRLADYLPSLAWKQRLVLTLRHREEYSYQEIGEVLSLSVLSVRKVHMEAVRALRRCFNHGGWPVRPGCRSFSGRIHDSLPLAAPIQKTACA